MDLQAVGGARECSSSSVIDGPGAFARWPIASDGAGGQSSVGVFDARTTRAETNWQIAQSAECGGWQLFVE